LATSYTITLNTVRLWSNWNQDVLEKIADAEVALYPTLNAQNKPLMNLAAV
jgi:hypothetical protein